MHVSGPTQFKLILALDRVSGRGQILGLFKPSKEFEFYLKAQEATEGFKVGEQHNLMALLDNSLQLPCQGWITGV